ncbi:hypothetical protein D554_1160 [Bordetella holmesii 30539]|uniref:N-acetyltransferase YedL n=1 Tax=Bordetella holmesii 1058 TaxID=1247648 RepID=A0ABN0S3J9_9BORD|nr:hypothetical protein D560_1692 [Bordetella holmesii ATCC 51541]AIT26353.1 hypothetical protein D558_1681 [Bordetella holmesii 44057]EWM44031.1 hypothetical protein D556_1696 [Bordetella holmesii 41130]EWM46927.1 hypothetical protein D555_1708 [Bordetella holmesii 35009]EWM51102.1 hypothetical protein D557_0953 [Bordetella holmesii 70147]EXF89954.1 hypothetical protein D554_1160 [Bordetella holmesii 30539]EXX96163.1 hypothetical protein D559_3607 [Bordetella holmesii 1058]
MARQKQRHHQTYWSAAGYYNGNMIAFRHACLHPSIWLFAQLYAPLVAFATK